MAAMVGFAGLSVGRFGVLEIRVAWMCREHWLRCGSRDCTHRTRSLAKIPKRDRNCHNSWQTSSQVGPKARRVCTARLSVICHNIPRTCDWDGVEAWKAYGGIAVYNYCGPRWSRMQDAAEEPPRLVQAF